MSGILRPNTVRVFMFLWSLAAPAGLAAEQASVSLEPILGSTVCAGQSITIDVYITADTALSVRGAETDLACNATGQLGSVGTLTIQTMNADPDGDGNLGPSNAGVPYLFGSNGIAANNLPPCRAAGAPSIGGINTELSPGDTRYFRTITLLASECSSGLFEISFEGWSTPPLSSNTTKVIHGFPGTPVQIEPESLVITVLPQIYGETVPSGVVDVDDILCTLSAFENFETCPSADIFPCDGGDGEINMDDIIGVLGAFLGDYLCPHPCP